MYLSALSRLPLQALIASSETSEWSRTHPGDVDPPVRIHSDKGPARLTMHRVSRFPCFRRRSTCPEDVSSGMTVTNLKGVLPRMFRITCPASWYAACRRISSGSRFSISHHRSDTKKYACPFQSVPDTVISAMARFFGIIGIFPEHSFCIGFHQVPGSDHPDDLLLFHQGQPADVLCSHDFCCFMNTDSGWR